MCIRRTGVKQRGTDGKDLHRAAINETIRLPWVQLPDLNKQVSYNLREGTGDLAARTHGEAQNAFNGLSH